MGSGLIKWNSIILGIISFDIIFTWIPLNAKPYTISSETNKSSFQTTFPHHTLATDTCYIPNLSDLNRKFRDYPHDLQKCINSKYPLLSNNQTHIWVETSNLHYFNATKDSQFRCCYKSFHFSVESVDLRSQGGDKSIRYRDCILFNETIEVLHEFVRVYCYYKTNIIYDQIFTYAISKMPIPASLTFISEIVHARTQMLVPYNVLIFGMSSVSHQNFHRTMTKTDFVLRDRDVVDFFGYSRLHDKKYGNLMPVLVGKKSSEMECGPATEDLFVWEQYNQHGFYTALVEDSKEDSISFCNFTKSPTDYYFKPFLVEAEDIKSHNYCTGDKYTYKILLNYIKQLCEILQKSKLFGVFWQSTMSTLGWSYPIVIDGDYAALFESLIKNGYLNQTVLILLSDLGTKYSSSREGYLENRLPLFKMVLPPSFRLNYSIAYTNLRSNSHRLITAFDVHATLIDLTDLNAIRDEELLLRSKKDYSEKQGVSLFLPISRKRTCSMVGVDDCICFEHKKMNNLNGITAKYAAKKIIPAINKIIESYPQCLYVKFSSLLEISKYTALHLKDNRFIEYLVKLRTEPAGTFQATVRFDSTWSIVSGISRLDYDHTRSYCVHDMLAKLYCFCEWPQNLTRLIPE